MDLGDDAVIISDRYIDEGGLLKFFKKKKREVIAAIDDQAIDEEVQIIETEETEEIEKIEEKQKKEEKQNLRLNFDMEELFENIDINKDVQKDFYNYCRINGLKEKDVNKFVLNEFLWEQVKNNVEINENLENKIVSFIGPTGVGKTTTIAKIAAKESIGNNKKVALITIDTYRIGAVEQLKTYADILNIPLEVVIKKEDMQKALKKFSTYDLVLIDSTGRSYKNGEQIDELKEYISGIVNMSTYLVISLTTKYRDVKAIIDSYSTVGFDKYILTKIDESSGYGNILNIARYIHKPLSYICTGQNVPDDIERANIDKLFYYIWGEIRV